MSIAAQLSAASSLAVVVPFTVTGTATGAETDYLISGRAVTIPAGATIRAITMHGVRGIFFPARSIRPMGEWFNC